MGKKRLEIIIETERTILIKRRSRHYAGRCDWCDAGAAAAAAASSTFEVDDLAQDRSSRDAKFRDAASGESGTCPRCGKQ